MAYFIKCKENNVHTQYCVSIINLTFSTVTFMILGIAVTRLLNVSVSGRFVSAANEHSGNSTFDTVVYWVGLDKE